MKNNLCFLTLLKTLQSNSLKKMSITVPLQSYHFNGRERPSLEHCTFSEQPGFGFGFGGYYGSGRTRVENVQGTLLSDYGPLSILRFRLLPWKNPANIQAAVALLLVALHYTHVRSLEMNQYVANNMQNKELINAKGDLLVDEKYNVVWNTILWTEETEELRRNECLCQVILPRFSCWQLLGAGRAWRDLWIDLVVTPWM